MKFDPLQGLSILIGEREPHLEYILEKYVKRGDTVIDIGANNGYFTLIMSKIVGPNGRVFAFEPIPKTADILLSNINVNNITNVVLIQKAVSDKSGEVTFRIPDSGKNLSMASMFWHQNDNNVEIIKIETVVIDEMDEIMDLHPSFIKIDVEGAEGNVISGMSKLILKNRPTIFIECSEIGRKVVWNIMNDLDYQCFSAIDVKLRINDISEYRHGDFLWMPSSQKL